MIQITCYSNHDLHPICFQIPPRGKRLTSQRIIAALLSEKIMKLGTPIPLNMDSVKVKI